MSKLAKKVEKPKHKLEIVRKTTDLNKSDFAKSIGFSNSQYSNYINSGQNIGEAVAMRVEKKYGVNAEWLQDLSEVVYKDEKYNSIYGKLNALHKDTPREEEQTQSGSGNPDDAVNIKAEGVAMTVNVMKEVHEIKGQFDMIKKFILELSPRINNLANQELDSLILKPQSEAIKKTSEKQN